MARNISSSISLPPIQPYWLQRWYFLMTDGTMWSFSVRDGANWTQAPPIPGSRVVTAISAIAGNPDTVFAACADGSIWAAVVTVPFTWAQVASTP